MTMSEVLLRFIQVSDTHLAHSSAARLARYNDPQSVPPQFADLILKMRQVAPQMVQQDDTQAAGAYVFESGRRLIEEINALPVDVDFILHTGDVAFDPDDDTEYLPIKELFSSSRFPVYYQPGNHDHSAYLQQHLSHLNDVLPTFDYELPTPNVQVICLDSSLGFLNDGQLEWLQSRIASGDTRPLIVTLHHNIVSYGDFFGDGVILRNHDEAHAILKSARPRLLGVFYGHMHMSMDTVQDDIHYFCCPSTYMQFDVFPGSDSTRGVETQSLPGFNLVTVMSDSLHVRRLHFRVDGTA
jgi:Icc protein